MGLTELTARDIDRYSEDAFSEDLEISGDVLHAWSCIPGNERLSSLWNTNARQFFSSSSRLRKAVVTGSFRRMAVTPEGCVSIGSLIRLVKEGKEAEIEDELTRL
jgi:hypothetical protein